MKKRVLSFLIACLMVVSTFIISKPLVHVHAVDGEDVTEWALPMDWTTGLKSQNPSADLHTAEMGYNYAEKADEPWKFAFYTDVDAGTTYVAESTNPASEYVGTSGKSGVGVGPSPYIETANNRWIFVGTQNYSGWYVCSRGRWQDTSIGKGDNINYMQFTHKNKSYTPAVVFIAPEDGLYSFSELVTGTLFEYTKDETTYTINSIATVRKNGTVLASFTPTADNPTKTLTGEIALKQGEELAFVFQQVSSTHCTVLPDANGSTYQFKLGETVVKKVGEYSESKKGATTELKVVFSNPETFTDDLGNVKLMGYDMSLESAGAANLYELERVIYATNTTDTYWVALDPRTKNTSKSYKWNSTESWEAYSLLWAGSTTTGEITHVGGSQLTTDTGSAYVFTAPNDGTYVFESALGCCWSASNSRYDDYTIMLADGTEIAYANNVGGANKVITTITAVATLEAGEQVIILKTPRALNGSNDGLATITITELDHVCANSVKLVEGNDATCVAGGTIAYYACSCGKNYVDADATELLTDDIDTPVDEDAHAPATEWTTDETGHWFVCNNGCGEKLSYAEHDWTNGACGTCGLACPAHDMKNAEGKCANCGMTHKHAWMDGVCETCGYECQHTGGTATCATRAMCEVCDSYYGDTVADNHEREGQWVDDVDGCYLYYGCCYTSEPVQDHVYDDDADMTCNHCGHDRTVAVKEEDFAGVFEDVFGEGESDVVAEAPEENAFDNYAAVAGSKADVYLGFNLELVGADADYVYLRHHILYNGGEVLVDGNEVTLNKVSGNYYYFDVAVAIGDFDKAHVVTIDGDTIVTASVYSYMKTAYGSGTLTAEQTNLLNALYQWDKAVADATYNG